MRRFRAFIVRRLRRRRRRQTPVVPISVQIGLQTPAQNSSSSEGSAQPVSLPRVSSQTTLRRSVSELPIRPSRQHSPPNNTPKPPRFNFRVRTTLTQTQASENAPNTNIQPAPSTSSRRRRHFLNTVAHPPSFNFTVTHHNNPIGQQEPEQHEEDSRVFRRSLSDNAITLRN